jgi:ABC-2 type transport system permease protein
MRKLRTFWSLVVASNKMYFRNKVAIFFTMFIPLAFMGVFGLLSQGSSPGYTLAITNQSQDPLAAQLMGAFKKVDAFKIEEVGLDTATEKLSKGKVDLQVVIPSDPAKIITHYNEAKPQSGLAANMIVEKIVLGFNAQITNTPPALTVQSSGVKTNNLGFIDFILPGILAVSIMQLGIFSVAFAFVSMKSTGMLRRLQATPTHPVQFVLAQGVTRLIVGVLQVVLLAGLGIWLFQFHLNGNPLEFLLVSLLGTVVFVAFGFVVAGWAKDENQAAPIANLISFPMMFLSGTFFPRDGFPGWLQTLTDYFPLTYLADALRRIANEGAHLTQLGGDLLGLTVWGIIIFAVAIKSFRWE